MACIFSSKKKLCLTGALACTSAHSGPSSWASICGQGLQSLLGWEEGALSADALPPPHARYLVCLGGEQRGPPTVPSPQWLRK